MIKSNASNVIELDNVRNEVDGTPVTDGTFEANILDPDTDEVIDGPFAVAYDETLEKWVATFTPDLSDYLYAQVEVVVTGESAGGLPASFRTYETVYP